MFREAASYLCPDSMERRIFSKLEHGAHRTHLRLDVHNDDSYDPNTHTIYWDPYSALRTTNGGCQSPALILGYEADHAVEPSRLRELGFNHRVRGYDNAEERRGILGSEAQPHGRWAKLCDTITAAHVIG